MSAKNSPAMMEVFARIAQERSRQRELFRTGKISFDVSSATPDANRKLRVLVEEVGEVAEAIDQIEVCESSPTPCRRHLPRLNKNLREELIQVAAVAVAWLESMEP